MDLLVLFVTGGRGRGVRLFEALGAARRDGGVMLVLPPGVYSDSRLQTAMRAGPRALLGPSAGVTLELLPSLTPEEDDPSEAPVLLVDFSDAVFA